MAFKHFRQFARTYYMIIYDLYVYIYVKFSSPSTVYRSGKDFHSEEESGPTKPPKWLRAWKTILILRNIKISRYGYIDIGKWRNIYRYRYIEISDPQSICWMVPSIVDLPPRFGHPFEATVSGKWQLLPGALAPDPWRCKSQRRGSTDTSRPPLRLTNTDMKTSHISHISHITVE